MKDALQNAKLWEARYAAVERSRQEYRENARQLVTENEKLQGAVKQVRQYDWEKGWNQFIEIKITCIVANIEQWYYSYTCVACNAKEDSTLSITVRKPLSHMHTHRQSETQLR